MIHAPEVAEGDLVVEIGPGKGALTKPLLETGAKVIAFELDMRMIEFLQVELAEYMSSGQLVLIHQDVLDINMQEFFQDKMPYKVVANIPYYITNAIIRKFLETDFQPSDMSLLMQKEVAERIVLRDGKQSILALSVSLFGEVDYVSKVSRKYFSPSPKVDSAIIHIGNISHAKIPNIKNQELFFLLIKTAFSQKRKMAINNLQKIATKDVWQDIFTQLGISENARAEDISLEYWIDIVLLYQNRK